MQLSYHSIKGSLITGIEVNGKIITVFNKHSEPEMSYILGAILCDTKSQKRLGLSSQSISIMNEKSPHHHHLHLDADHTPYHTHFEFDHDISLIDLQYFMSAIVTYQFDIEFRNYLQTDFFNSSFFKELKRSGKKVLPQKYDTKRIFFPNSMLEEIPKWKPKPKPKPNQFVLNEDSLHSGGETPMSITSLLNVSFLEPFASNAGMLTSSVAVNMSDGYVLAAGITTASVAALLFVLGINRCRRKPKVHRPAAKATARRFSK